MKAARKFHEPKSRTTSVVDPGAGTSTTHTKKRADIFYAHAIHLHFFLCKAREVHEISGAPLTSSGRHQQRILCSLMKKKANGRLIKIIIKMLGRNESVMFFAFCCNGSLALASLEKHIYVCICFIVSFVSAHKSSVLPT